MMRLEEGRFRENFSIPRALALMPSGWTSFKLPPHLEHWLIMVSGDISYDEMYTPIIREMAVRWLELPYSDDPNDIMYPFFDVKKLKYSSSPALKKQYLDKMFSRVDDSFLIN